MTTSGVRKDDLAVLDLDEIDAGIALAAFLTRGTGFFEFDLSVHAGQLDLPERRADRFGLGWIISFAQGHRPPILTKAGGIAGFMTYVVLAPTRRVGAFVAVNRLNFPMFEGLTAGMHELVAELAPR